MSQEVLEEILEKYGEVQKNEEGKIIGIKTDKGYNIAIKDILNEEQIRELEKKPEEKKITKVTLNKRELTIEEAKFTRSKILQKNCFFLFYHLKLCDIIFLP